MKFQQKFKNFLFKKIAQKRYTKDLSDIKIKKILIIRDGGIGDAILSYPLIRELKKFYPKARIDVYASLNNYFMYKYVPWVDTVYLKHKKRHWFKTWLEVFKMKQNHYDLAIDDTVIRFHRTLYTMIINPKFVLASSGTKKRYGFDRSELSFYYKVYKTTDKIIHIVDDRLRVLEFLGINNYSNKMEFPLPKEKNKDIIKYLNKFKGYKLIGLNTDASHEDRTLNTKQIIDLCKLLNHKNIKIIPFCVPSKFNYFKELIENNNLANVELPFKTKSIYEAAQIVKELDLLITPDTSFVHIASGLNIPTIGLFWNDPTKYILCAPRSDISIAITPQGKESNLKNIDLKEIQEKAFEILNIKK
ncbi:glycosyltransferase family 9 protein [Halarcobacter anaerophilus]|uniref:glycosyltransferase family 9 protein n=1 Tax=Halarcobacter anaerophilus TaxID=877500 RepID=UPI0005C94FDF|nr:glycosyltransferase family 9 protein [Halarcobacter anaerophilus]